MLFLPWMIPLLLVYNSEPNKRKSTVILVLVLATVGMIFDVFFIVSLLLGYSK